MRQHGYSKRHTVGRKVHLKLKDNTGQVHAALIPHQDVADGDALAKWLHQIPREQQIDVIVDNGAYDTKPWYVTTIAARSAIPSIPPREGAAHWPAHILGMAWRDGSVDTIVRDGRRE